ncbi:MAG: hypothetical protein K8U57_05870 [Planctomycetes bacterium]|nr:hypothetical protein [Planctomycetota bacterium]
MSEINTLQEQIDAQFTAAARRAEVGRQEAAREQQDRDARLAKFDAVVELFCTIWRPRLELLRSRFAELVKVNPVIKPHNREATFSFVSERYKIELKFSAGPDYDIRNLVLEYDLQIIPVLIKFDSHSRLVQPLDNIDERAVADWLDERILGFVSTYVALQGDTFFLEHMAQSSAPT